MCAGNDYIELINTGGAAANLGGWMLYDNTGPTGEDAFTLPPQFSLTAGEIRFLCRNSFGSFRFGIDSADTVTLADSAGTIVSTTGVISGSGSSSSSYSFSSSTNTWSFGPPTPGTANGATPTIGNPIINEVVAVGTTSPGACSGGAFVEIFNDAIATLDLTGFTLRAGSQRFVLSGAVNRFAFRAYCTGGFIIGNNDNVELLNPQDVVVSSTGPIGGSSPRPSALDLSWVRVTDLVITSAPFTPFYQYSTTPTPNTFNVFPFVPVQLPIQSCGIQTRPLSMASDYVFQSLINLNVNGGNPELSGGTFDPRTCNHLSVGDNGEMLEVSIVGSTATLVLRRPLIGGSLSSSLLGSIPDSEGVCFYRDTVNGDKLAILDERSASGMFISVPSLHLLTFHRFPHP